MREIDEIVRVELPSDTAPPSTDELTPSGVLEA